MPSGRSGEGADTTGNRGLRAYFKAQLDIQGRAASALLSYAEHHDEALDAMREAADGEDALGKHPVSPGTILPARELLGDLPVDAGRFEEALGAYEASLKLHPGRFAALFGAGHAAELAGERDVASRALPSRCLASPDMTAASPRVPPARRSAPAGARLDQEPPK